MGWQAVIASGINAAAGIGGNILNNYYNKKNVARQNEYNERLYHYDNWYNSPEQQVQRLKEAGLNPNLVYGTGSTSNVSRGPVKSADMTNIGGPLDNVANTVRDSLLMYQDARMREAQIDNVQAQTENTKARTATESVNQVLKTVTGSKIKEETRQLEGLWNFNVQTRDEEARQAAMRTDQMMKQLLQMDQDTVIKNLDIAYRQAGLSVQQIEKEKKQAELVWQSLQNEWAKAGVTAGDNAIIRTFVRMMNSIGITDWNKITDAARGFLGGFKAATGQ